MATFNGRVTDIEDNRNKVDDISSVTSETESVKYPTVKAVKAHVTDNNNPHNVTAEQLNLSDLENESPEGILNRLGIVATIPGYYIKDNMWISSNDYIYVTLNNKESGNSVGSIQFTGKGSIKCTSEGSDDTGYWIIISDDIDKGTTSSFDITIGNNTSSYVFDYSVIDKFVFCSLRINDVQGNESLSVQQTGDWITIDELPFSAGITFQHLTVYAGDNSPDPATLAMIVRMKNNKVQFKNISGSTIDFNNINFYYKIS